MVKQKSVVVGFIYSQQGTICLINFFLQNIQISQLEREVDLAYSSLIFHRIKMKIILLFNYITVHCGNMWDVQTKYYIF